MARVNESALDWEATDRDAATFRRKRLSAAAGGEDIGCSLYELPPGACAWPYHWHAGNEEAIYVLAGAGTIRLDGERDPLVAGDYVALPPGPESAHRVVNDGDEPLRYLVVSTMDDPDVLRYPDSGKVGVFAGSPPGGESPRSIHGYFREEDAVDYWRGERGGETPDGRPAERRQPTGGGRRPEASERTTATRRATANRRPTTESTRSPLSRRRPGPPRAGGGRRRTDRSCRTGALPRRRRRSSPR